MKIHRHFCPPVEPGAPYRLITLSTDRRSYFPEDQLRKHTVQALHRSSPIFGVATPSHLGSLPFVVKGAIAVST